MKKILSVILTIVALLSVLTMPEISASAKTAQPTYIAKSTVYKCSKGTVVNDSGELTYYPKTGKKIVLIKDYNTLYNNLSFFVRGSYLYYTQERKIELKDDDYDLQMDFCRIRLDGKNQKLILENCKDDRLFGAYGSTVVFGTFSYNLDTKETVKFKEKNGYYKARYSQVGGDVLFNGKIYTCDKKVNVTTGKVEKSAKKKKLAGTENYLFYVNSKKDLVRLDKNGKKVKLEKNIQYIAGTNDANTVLFVKNENLYRKTKTSKAVRIVSKADFIKKYCAKSGYTKKEISKINTKNTVIKYKDCALTGNTVGMKCVVDIDGTGYWNNTLLRMDMNDKSIKNLLETSDAEDFSFIGVYKDKVYFRNDTEMEEIFYSSC